MNSIGKRVVLLFAFLWLVPGSSVEAQFAENFNAKSARLDFLASELEDLREAREKLEVDVKTLAARRNELMAEQFKAGISSESWPEIVRELQSQRVQLLIELAGLDARRLALREQAARQSASGMHAELIAALEKQVEAARRGVEEMIKLRDRDAVSSADVRQAEAQLLNAEIRLLETCAALQSEGAGSGEEQRAIELDHAEQGARLSQVESLLRQFADKRPTIDEMRRLEREEGELVGRMQGMESEMNATSREIRDLRAQLRLDQRNEDEDN